MGSCLCKTKRGDENQTEYKEQVTLVYHGTIAAQVNKEDLLEKSAYFRAITNTSYKDHKSDLIDVSIPVGLGSFEKVVKYINTGDINLNVKSLFETLGLAQYLKIESLQRFCLDHFTYNLNRESLELQLSTIKECSFIGREYKKRALMFKDSGRPSLSGLYFLQRVDSQTYSLKMFSKHTEHSHVISTFEMKDFSPLHFFDNMLCMVEFSRGLCTDNNVSLFQYDLISGNINRYTLENAKFSEASKPVICSDKQNLFVISEVKNDENKILLSLSIFQGQSSAQSLKIWRTKTFNPSPYYFKSLNLFFSFCYDNKLYVFYSQGNKIPEFSYFTFDDIYMLTVCVKTLRGIENEKLSTKTVELTKGTKKEEFVMKNFEKMFFYVKREKLFIRTNNKCFGAYDPFDKVLVFDLKNDYFYLTAEFLPLLKPVHDNYNFKFTPPARDSNSLYGIRYMFTDRTDERPTEVRSFQLRNDKLVENGGVKWKCSEGSTEKSEPVSAVFV